MPEPGCPSGKIRQDAFASDPEPSSPRVADNALSDVTLLSPHPEGSSRHEIPAERFADPRRTAVGPPRPALELPWPHPTRRNRNARRSWTADCDTNRGFQNPSAHKRRQDLSAEFAPSA